MPRAVGRPGANAARTRKPAVAPGWGDLAYARRSGPTACRLVSLLTGRRWVLRSESLAMAGRTERARAHARAVSIFFYGASCIGSCEAGVYLCVASRAVEEHGCAASFGNANVLHATDQLVHVAADPRTGRAPSRVDASEVADESESVAGAAAGRSLRRGRCAGECPHAWVATPGGRVSLRFTAGAVTGASALGYAIDVAIRRQVDTHFLARVQAGVSQRLSFSIPRRERVLCSELISRSAR